MSEPLDAVERDALLAAVGRMTDDEYKTEVLAQLRRINGTIRKHEEDLYGDPARGLVGAVATTKSNAARLDAVDDRWNRIYGFVFAFAALGTLGGAELARLIH